MNKMGRVMPTLQQFQFYKNTRSISFNVLFKCRERSTRSLYPHDSAGTYLLTKCGSAIVKCNNCSVHESSNGLCISQGVWLSIRANADRLQCSWLKSIFGMRKQLECKTCNVELDHRCEWSANLSIQRQKVDGEVVVNLRAENNTSEWWDRVHFPLNERRMPK